MPWPLHLTRADCRRTYVASSVLLYTCLFQMAKWVADLLVKKQHHLLQHGTSCMFNSSLESYLMALVAMSPFLLCDYYSVHYQCHATHLAIWKRCVYCWVEVATCILPQPALIGWSNHSTTVLCHIWQNSSFRSAWRICLVILSCGILITRPYYYVTWLM